MRIIVMGGAGDVGSRAAEVLAEAEDVDEVAVGDRDVAAAERLAASLRSTPARVTARQVDATDAAGLVRAMRGYDVVASALGPFYLFEEGMVRAAIEAGVDYASVCDEFNPLEKVLDELHAPAERAGCTAVCGLGTSPGLTNVGIRLFASEMDRVHKADVSVYQPLDAGGGEAVLRHMVFIMSGRVAVWRDGRRRLVPACSESREVEMPAFGRLRVWNMGHAEPVTIPRYIEGIDEVGFYMGYGRGSRALVAAARAGLFGGARRRDASARLLAAVERRTRSAEPAPGSVRVDVWGEKDGAPVHRMACGVGTMREATAQSLAVGTLMLARREGLTRTSGVFAPEACLEPRRFIDGMRAHGVDAFEDLAMTRPVGAG